MKLANRLAAAIGCLALLTQASADSATESYRLQFKVTLESRPAASPDLIVEEGKEAVADVGSERGDRTRLRVTAWRVEPPQGRSGRWIRLSIQLFEKAGQRWIVRAEPIMVVPLGEQGAAVAAPDTVSTFSSMDDATGSAIELTVVASRWPG